jgi:hypothetical protein
MELKPLNETIGWIWPKQIITPASNLKDFELVGSFISRNGRVLRRGARRKTPAGAGRTQ